MQSDHLSVVSWVFKCTSTREPNNLPDYVKWMYPGWYFYAPLADPKTSQVHYGSAREPENLERELVQLSFALWTQRYSLRLKAHDSFVLWQAFAITTIAIGMFTTILISLSATDVLNERSAGFRSTIRILAIVFPALGTACAAVTAFYGPQAEWTQASRELMGLTNLHEQMSVAVWDLDCLTPSAVGGAQAETGTTADDKQGSLVSLTGKLDSAVSPKGKPGPADALREALKQWKSRFNESQLASINGISDGSANPRLPPPPPSPSTK
jgi:hypothetical protein